MEEGDKKKVDEEEEDGESAETAAKAAEVAAAAAKKAAEDEEKEEEEEGKVEESYKVKAEKIFAAAVDMKASAIKEELTAAKDKEVAAIAESLEAKIDEYCDYVVGQWLEENKFKVETSLRTEIAENFIAGLKDLFSENYFNVPEEKADLCESLGATVSRLKSEKQDLIEEIEMANMEILEIKKNSIIESVGSDLFESQKAKLKKLAESISATDVQDFEEKLSSIKDVFFSESASVKITKLDEKVALTEDYNGNSEIQGYANFLSKSANNRYK